MTDANMRPAVFAIKQIIGRSGSWQVRRTYSNSGTFYSIESVMDEGGLVVAVIDLMESVKDLAAYREKLESNLREDEANSGSDIASDVRTSMWHLVYAIEQAEILTQRT